MSEPPPADVNMPAEERAATGAPRASVAPRAAGWREQLLGAESVLVLAGAWLVVSPLVFGYGEGEAAWIPIAGGALVVLLAILRLTGAWRSRALSALHVATGALLAASAPLLEAPIGGALNQGLMGGIVMVLALIGLAGTQRGRELHGDDS